MTTHSSLTMGRGAECAKVTKVNVFSEAGETPGAILGREGISDMDYSRESGRMILSVGPDIQVWDINALKKVNTFRENQIDLKGVRGTSFTVSACGNYLIFGNS